MDWRAIKMHFGFYLNLHLRLKASLVCLDFCVTECINIYIIQNIKVFCSFAFNERPKYN